jgi:hypothetical protein
VRNGQRIKYSIHSHGASIIAHHNGWASSAEQYGGEYPFSCIALIQVTHEASNGRLLLLLPTIESTLYNNESNAWVIL